MAKHNFFRGKIQQNWLNVWKCSGNQGSMTQYQYYVLIHILHLTVVELCSTYGFLTDDSGAD